MGVLSGGLLYDKMGHAYEGWGFYDGALFRGSGIVMFVALIPCFGFRKGGSGSLITGPVTDSLIHLGKSAVAAYQVSFLASAVITLTGVAILLYLFQQGHLRTVLS